VFDQLILPQDDLTTVVKVYCWLRRMEARHLMEVLGKKLRNMMPWLKGGVIS
jgi:hypothetical protein